jgi:hypothetical protein
VHTITPGGAVKAIDDDVVERTRHKKSKPVEKSVGSAE